MTKDVVVMAMSCFVRIASFYALQFSINFPFDTFEGATSCVFLHTGTYSSSATCLPLECMYFSYKILFRSKNKIIVMII